MEEKKISRNIIFSVVAVLLLVVVVAGATYAYFTATASTAKQEVKTGSLAMGFESGEFLRADALMPISDSEIKTKAAELDFSVTNQGTEHMNLTISLTDIEISDDLKDVDFRWGLYNKDKDLGIAFGIFEDMGTQTSVTLLTDTIIDAVLDENEPDITKNYTLRVWIHDDGANQNYMQGETFSAKVTVDGEPVKYTPEECFGFNNGTVTSYDYETCGLAGVDVVIPKSIDGVAVTTIGSNFVYCDGGCNWWTDDDVTINSMILPDTITTINNEAFVYSSALYDSPLTIPDSVITVGNTGLHGANIRNLPESVTTVGENSLAFNSIDVVPGSISEVSSSAFYSLESNNIVLMEGITTIGESAFSELKNTSIEIPSTVTTIVKDAFGQNYSEPNLTEIVVRGKSSLADFTDATGLTTEGGLPEGVNVVFRP